MNDFTQAFQLAAMLISRFDPQLRDIVVLSLGVSLTASGLAFIVGSPFGLTLAICRFPGKQALIVAANALLGLPPVVVGLAVYLLLSRSGPLGSLGILFTPTAMIIAQAILGIPIVVALVHRMTVDLWATYGEALLVDGASHVRAAASLMNIGREGLIVAFLAAFGRAIAEVGAIIIVGGNIRGYTRTMTTAIALETSKGELSFALALGIILIVLSMTVSTLSHVFGRALGR
ncbi:ABC transporter permease [Bradyrhizobium diazoefficiens]|uniref:ABC transporter permease n=1 Tax=Bradyrhizobium diazoefficiens TaxID=1355477 RepID=UPI00190D595A|nr:ABC transporter permease [Bradyrhizobium diazoefficiens]MBK3665753.1 ABC transporter permease [Bradyrhizobium diazoefficiens]